MILKLTVNGKKLLVDTTSIAILETVVGCNVFQQSTDEELCFEVKETIEEIEQQIKEGGICGTK